VTATEANRRLNELAADKELPLAVFHDHFIGRPGGVVIFFAETPEERAALESPALLDGWEVEVRPLVFSRNPAAFDEQISFTLRQYRGMDWETLQREQRPSYGDSGREAETASEDADQ